MNVVLGVQAFPKGDHPERSELQLRKGDQSWEGSRERNRGPMNENRIEGGAERGERARCRSASMVTTRRRYRSIVVADEKAAHARLRYILAHGAKEGPVGKSAEWPGLNCIVALTS